MKVVLYLSGKQRTRQFHAEQDSVAASVSIPKKLQEQFIEAALMIGALDAPLPKTVDWDDKLPTIEAEAFMDLFEDLQDNVEFGGTEPLLALKNNFDYLVNSECSCGVYHIVY